MEITRATIDTPLGPMLALASDAGLCALEFTSGSGNGAPRLTRLDRRMARWFPPHTIRDGDSNVIAGTRRWLASYFGGMSADITPLPLQMFGAPFELRVWDALRQIPAGETRSYGAIAAALGDRGASRAVGAANGANPIAIIVPCHRVIGASGSLVGYGGGLHRKTWLLDHERRWRSSAQLALI